MHAPTQLHFSQDDACVSSNLTLGMVQESVTTPAEILARNTQIYGILAIARQSLDQLKKFAVQLQMRIEEYQVKKLDLVRNIMKGRDTSMLLDWLVTNKVDTVTPTSTKTTSNCPIRLLNVMFLEQDDFQSFLQE